MEPIDNGGFDEAVIEIWGPTPNDRWRTEVTFPDGSGFVSVNEGEDLVVPSRFWSSLQPLQQFTREISCFVTSTEGSEGWDIGNAPIAPWGLLDESFHTHELSSLLDSDLPPEPQMWQGRMVDVYRFEDFAQDEFGDRSLLIEYWIDPVALRLERKIELSDSEALGTVSSVTEVILRTKVPANQVSFDNEGLFLAIDRSERDNIEEADAIVTTTSIPLLSQPLAADAVRIEYEELPSDDLRALVASTDLLWSIRAGEDGLYLASRPGRPALLFATACSVLTSVDLPADWKAAAWN